MRKPLVIGNWKMHGSLAQNRALVNELLQAELPVAEVDIVICAPYIYVQQVAGLVADSGVLWGAQNCAAQAEGAFTGEVSASMLADVGCNYALIGHSERRAFFAENDAEVAQKFACLGENRIHPVLCVGETIEQRDAGETLLVIATQLAAVAKTNPVPGWANAVLAYEPVWAIGTGKTATPEQAQEVHAYIREQLAQFDTDVARAARILYGGSVKPGNAAELFAQPDIDGGLIGGASLIAEDFLAICHAANEVRG